MYRCDTKAKGVDSTSNGSYCDWRCLLVLCLPVVGECICMEVVFLVYMCITSLSLSSLSHTHTHTHVHTHTHTHTQ